MSPLVAPRTQRLTYISSAVAAETALRFCSQAQDAFSMKFEIVCLAGAMQSDVMARLGRSLRRGNMAAVWGTADEKCSL
jgi:hypothetical protein